ncbi:scavenger receptor class B member 1 isoform X1 [Sceloporus undulatus]|uniref:scavenger receptor class B member 1 isoform X1 n=1 Tax=Sceloporus undulatus TaxID=8520 RepID=UPI001C4D3400|nr:scavenger receptor class B member 1 isoform X1 [Sceloporus undulatus]
MGGCSRPCMAAVGLSIAGFACLVFGVTMILMVPGIVRDQVTKNVRLEPNSMAFNLWKDIPVPFYMSIYFFEVLNPNEVLRGEKPIVNQRGPYVYREYREKENITFNDNDTLSFLEYRRFHFQADMSNGLESDYVVVPNMLVLGAAVMLEDLPFAVKLTVSSTFALFKQSAFMNRTVGEIMWGYDDPLIDFLNSIKPGLVPFKGKFGLFADLNNSNTGLFTVYTGMADISRAHMIDTWNGLKEVSYWNSDQCNLINGTAGELWPPFRTPSTPLEFYSPDACRSMTLIFSHYGKFKGVPTNRYVAPKTLFANGTDYPPNEGFCPCLQSGIQNVSSCRLNAPVFISHPHFLNADPSLLEAVGGLHPNEEEHGLFLDLHAMTGIPMKCSIKLQLNIFIKHVPGILQTGRVKPVVLPFIWFAESGEIEGGVLHDFYVSLVLIPSVLGYVQYCLVALGSVLLITAALFGLKSKTLTVLRQKEGSIVIGTLSAPKFYNSGSGTGYSYHGPQGKCFLFWSSNKGSGPKEAIQASKEKNGSPRKEDRF